MAQTKYQAADKVYVFRGNRRRFVCDLTAEINTNTKTTFYSTPKILDIVAAQKYPGDEGWHWNYKRDLLLVASTTDVV